MQSPAGRSSPGPANRRSFFCVDGFGPLNLQSHPGRQWAAAGGKHKTARPRAAAPPPRHLPAHRGGAAPVRRLRAGRGQTVRAHQAAQDPGPVPGVLPLPALPLPAHRCASRSSATTSTPPDHPQRQARRSLGAGEQRRDRLHANELFLVNRIEAQFTALRYFALDGTGHATHQEQGSMMRRYIIWRNNHAYDQRLRQIVARANVA
jgi:hypothetical protein